MDSGLGKYRLGPFILGSELPLPELTLQSTGEPDAFIRVGIAPDALEDVVANETRWWASRDRYLLRVPGVANFYVRGGREVVVEPAAGAVPGDIRAYLLAPIFSVLCYQAGMYSLHASSVKVRDGVVAFLGHSGAGKSTLAACMERRGYPVISDDICLLDPRPSEANTGGDTLVIPVAPALKLWRSALEHMGAATDEMPRVYSSDEKFRMKVGEIEDRLPLREVVFLEWAADPEAAVEIAPVRGVQAVKSLMDFTHYDYLMKPTGRQQGNFLLCGRILSQVTACNLRRPRNFARLESVIDSLEEHLQGRDG